MPPTQHCRFYEQKFPEVDDVVMVNVKSIAEMGAYVQLLEYDGVEGMILLSELSRRRIRSINKLIRVGRNECVVVLRVDKDKGYIDLSKRRVSAEEVKKCEDKFMKAKAVHSIMRHVADAEKLDLEKLMENTAWTLERTRGGAGSAYDAMKLALGDNPDVLNEMKVDEALRKIILDNIRRRLTPQPVKLRSDIEVSCYEYEGIDAVKYALRAGLAVSDEAHPVKINLIAPPLYVMTTTSLDKDRGIAKLTEAIEAIQKAIGEKSGSVTVKMAPRSVTEADDKDLASMMEQYERENTEVGGDEDASEPEEVGMSGPAVPAE